MKPVVLAAALAACLSAALPAMADTFTPSMSARIDRLAQNEIARGHTPGIAIGVVEDGRLVYARGFGFANVAKRVAATPDTEFYIGGVTMQFTAAAVLMLAQDGKLKLSDKVTQYVPELSVARDVTVAELLQQTSGLPDPGELAADPTRSVKTTDLFSAINKLNAAAPAGAAYADNPLNYMLAGTIVERVAGESFSDFLEQRIFLPLVMDHTFYAGDTGISASHAVGYTRGGSGFQPARAWDRTWLFGGRGLVSTVYDLSKWDIEMPILLRVDAVRSMLTPSGISGPAKYGLGWVIDRRGGRLYVWYDGEIAGYHAVNALLPDDHVAVIVMANADAMHGGPVTLPQEMAARILDVVLPPNTAHLDNAIVMRAREWLERVADRRIDRTQLTPAFNVYLTDTLIERSNFAALGKLQTMIPIDSTTEPNGDTVYEFLVVFPHARYHYKFGVAPDGKIDEILLVT